MRWTRKGIIEEIKRLHQAGDELNYSTVEDNHLNLVRAAAWHFGTWRRAVEGAGLDYESLSKYQRWNRERIVERILELHELGADLSWRAVSMEVDQPLAAAALRPNGFSTWKDAIIAAGLNHDEIARYRSWDEARCLRELKEMAAKGTPLSSKAVQESNQPLYCAAKRRFKTWDGALEAAGLDPTQIRLRRAPVNPKPRQRALAKGVAQPLLPGLPISPPAKAPRADARTAKKAAPAAKKPVPAKTKAARSIAKAENVEKEVKPIVKAKKSVPVAKKPKTTKNNAGRTKQSPF